MKPNMSDSDHEKRIRRLELQLWGPDDEPDKGIMARVMMTESIAFELKADAKRIQVIMLGILVSAVIDLIMNRAATHTGSTQTSENFRNIPKISAIDGSDKQP